MKERSLYLLAYDIGSPSRSRRALKLIKAHAIGRQKSVFECLLNRREKQSLMADLAAVLDQQEDYFLLLPLQAKEGSYPLGLASRVMTSDCYLIG
ncbi:MAG: CRISPR-associated endonuclease Cas2 [Gammaproteobacteria bacterium]|nr:CRISPR-associated endonuclease Cas2 [Gammaproteobacteria bacterium]MDQ7074740.1 CRISPR-associated endonuclease Cas2 [Gammaproteobacteria bacterium]